MTDTTTTQGAPAEMFPGVRIAGPHDEDAIYEFLLGLWDENGMFPLDEGRARQQIRVATEHRGGIIGIIDGPDGIEASIGLFAEPWWYSTDYAIDEKWAFVRPDCRKSPHARNLIEFAKWVSERMQLPLFMGIITTERTAAKERLYQRQLVRAGGLFLWGLEYSRLGPELASK